MSADAEELCSALGLTDCVEIGRGGFATVHRAWDPTHRRRVALKVLDQAITTDECRMRFERERAALGSLSHHPGIVTLFDSGIAPGGSPFLVMEYHVGGSLADHVDAPLPWWRAAEIVADLAGAVETAHRAGICHRDIKPDNVLMSGYGSWVLADFGIALRATDPRTRTGEFVASLAHTAPEVFEGAAPSPAQDVYALGTTLVTLLTGRDEFAPRPDESLPSTLRRIASEPVTPLGPYGVPEAVEAAVRAATEKSPAERTGDCLAFAQLLNDELVRAGHVTKPIQVEGDESDTITAPPDVHPLRDLRNTASRTARATRASRRAATSVALGSLATAAVLVGGALAIGGYGSDAPADLAEPSLPIVVEFAVSTPTLGEVGLGVPQDAAAQPLLSDEEVGRLVAEGLTGAMGDSSPAARTPETSPLPPAPQGPADRTPETTSPQTTAPDSAAPESTDPELRAGGTVDGPTPEAVEAEDQRDEQRDGRSTQATRPSGRSESSSPARPSGKGGRGTR